MMTIKVVINLITGEGQFRHPLHYCLGSSLGSLLQILGNFSGAKFHDGTTTAPTIKVSLSLLSPSILPHPEHSTPSCSLLSTDDFLKDIADLLGRTEALTNS